MSLLGILHDKFNAVFQRSKSPSCPITPIRTERQAQRAELRAMNQSIDYSYSTSCGSGGKRKRDPCDSLSPLKLHKTGHYDDFLCRDQDGDVVMLDDDVARLSAHSISTTPPDTFNFRCAAGDKDDAEGAEETHDEDEDDGIEDEDTVDEDDSDAESQDEPVASESDAEVDDDSEEDPDREVNDKRYNAQELEDKDDHGLSSSIIRHSIEPPTFSADLSDTIAIKRAEGWDEAHLSLLYHLHNRGKEPILPPSFQKALHFMPSNLFTTSDEHAFLDAHHTSSFHGERYLTRLLHLGGYMRSSHQDNAKPEKQLKRFLKPYMNWALRDTGLQPSGRNPSIVTVVTASDGSDPLTLEEKTRRVLHRLAARHRQAFEAGLTGSAAQIELPTCYAIVSLGTHVLLVAYKTAHQSDALHIVADYDFGSTDHDVWNALALALIVCHGRDVQMQIARELNHAGEGEDSESDDDPDA